MRLQQRAASALQRQCVQLGAGGATPLEAEYQRAHGEATGLLRGLPRAVELDASREPRPLLSLVPRPWRLTAPRSALPGGGIRRAAPDARGQGAQRRARRGSACCAGGRCSSPSPPRPATPPHPVPYQPLLASWGVCEWDTADKSLAVLTTTLDRLHKDLGDADALTGFWQCLKRVSTESVLGERLRDTLPASLQPSHDRMGSRLAGGQGDLRALEHYRAEARRLVLNGIEAAEDPTARLSECKAYMGEQLQVCPQH